MSADNLTGQYISSTFRKILQLSDSGSYITDGTGSVVSILPVTASWALYALNGGSGTAGYASHSQAVASTTWTFQHNLGVQYPVITVYDNNDKIIVPQEIVADNSTQATIYFPLPISGKAVAAGGASAGGGGGSETDPIFVSKSGSFATTGSNVFIGNQIITGSVDITGSLTVNTVNVGQNTLNFIDSNGNILNALSVSGSTLILATGSISASAGGFTGSLYGTSSWATQTVTASFAPNYVLNSVTASMLAPYLLNSQTSSFVQNSDTGSFTTTSSFNSFTSSIQNQVTSLTNATSSYVQNNVTASFVLTSSFNSFTSSYKNDSSSFDSRINNINVDTSYLVTTTSFYSFTGSYKNDSSSFDNRINNINIDTSYLVTTTSFYSFTSSYKNDSSSFDSRINNINVDTSFLVTTTSFNSFTSSVNNFTSSYNTGSFTGSFNGIATSASYALFNPYIVTVGTRIYTDDTFITAGSKGYKHIGYNANIIKTRTIANTNGNIDVNVKRNGITLGTISLSNQSSSLDTTLTGWTTQLNTDDLLEFYVSQSSTYITDISIFIDIQARQ